MDFNFNDNLEVNNLDRVPEQFRALYAEAEEGFRLRSDDETVSGAVAAITGLNKALIAARAEAKENRKSKVDLSPLADFGESPEEIVAAFNAKIDELQGELAKGKDAKLNLETIKADLAKAHSKDLESRDREIESLKQGLYDHLVENRARQDIVNAGGVPDLLMPVLKANLRPIVEDGKYSVRVVDSEGNIRYSGVTGEAMTPAERVAELKADDVFSRAFKSEAPTGTGSAPSRPVFTKPKQDLSPVDKISAGLQKRRR